MNLFFNKEEPKPSKHELDHQKELNDIARHRTRAMFNFNDPEVVVISVERMPDNKTEHDEHTLIGYYIKSDPRTIHQWILFCSRKNHCDLVESFEKSIQRPASSGIEQKTVIVG